VWEVDGGPPATLKPPHVENIVVRSKRWLRKVALGRVAGFIEKVMPPIAGGPEQLYEGLVQGSPGGALYVAHREDLPESGIPRRSTMFWRPDCDLTRDEHSKRIRYRYPTHDGGCTVTFVGFQEPLPLIPAGALLRVSLAHWWRPEEHPETELRCYVQLSGWFLQDGSPPAPGAGRSPAASTAKVTAPGAKEETAEVSARTLLKSVFGYDDFLPFQSDIIANVLARRDTLAIMPTGGGKSLCYQLPALLFDGVTVVVSPLIALMQDQVDALGELGVPAAFLNSTVDYHTYLETAAAVREGRVKLVYMAPETLLRPETLLMLDHSDVACLTIDEAHCISSWGHDFRPEYRQLLPLRERYPKAVCLALTATATRRVQADIEQVLGFGEANEFVASFNRPNLFLAVQPRTDTLGQALAFLNEHRDQSGIIYCHTRKDVETLAAQLRHASWSALPYHAGLDDDTRREHQRAFSRDEALIMVATIAFGMGINKSNIRFILHVALPENLENYYQQIGRAGRDGLPADCLLLWAQRDLHTIRHFIEEGPLAERPGKEARLQAMIRYAQAPGCRRVPLLSYFGETAPDSCDMCDNCLTSRAGAGVETVDMTAPARLFVECVRQTGETFGPAHIVDVLRGSRSQRVLRWKHDRVPAYGKGRALAAKQWRDLAQQLIAQGILVQDEGHGGLALGQKARAVLDGAAVRVPARLAPTIGTASAEVEYEHGLFEVLRKLRGELARAANVPPYVVFSDRTLQEMARIFPQTPGALLQVPGVGERKLAQYGERFLAVIRTYCAAHGL
jgi:ATP-dependent DNA helicase RecQ